jgi:hypothetical protein
MKCKLETINKMKAKTKILLGLAALMTAGIKSQAQYAFTELEYPGVPFGSTYANGIEGANIVGAYWDTNNVSHGFLLIFNATNWSTLDAPGASTASGQGTTAFGISGTNIVGNYTDINGVEHGFLLSGTNWSTLDDPSGSGSVTSAQAISGANIVGYYNDGSGNSHAFLYNLTTGTWTNLDCPFAGSQGTQATAISGSTVAGAYFDSSGNYHGFLYNIITTNWTPLDDPLGQPLTYIQGISGTNVSGTYFSGTNAFAFVYNGSTWINDVIDPNAGIGQYPNGGCFGHGICGDALVGSYYNTNGLHGYVATPIPQVAITRSTKGPTLSWPHNPFVRWTLEQKVDLSATNWTTIGGVSTDGTNDFITATPTPGNAFFRLNHQ